MRANARRCVGVGAWAVRRSGGRCSSGWKGSWGRINSGELRRESAEVRAERIMAEDVERPGWTEVQLRERRKRNAAELPLAARLRHETTLTVGWIDNRLNMGTRKSAASKLQPLGQARIGPCGGTAQDYGLTPLLNRFYRVSDTLSHRINPQGGDNEPLRIPGAVGQSSGRSGMGVRQRSESASNRLGE